MSNTAICLISVALNIKFNSEKGLRDTKNCRHCNCKIAKGSGVIK